MSAGDDAGRMLADFAVFAALDPDQRHALAADAELVDHPAGTVLVHQGEHAHEVHLLLSGGAFVESDGQHVVTLSPGEFVGEVGVLDGSPRVATVRTEEPARTMRWTADAFDKHLAAIPELRRLVTRALTAKLRTATEDLSTMASNTDALLQAMLALQQSSDPEEAERARAQAAALIADSAKEGVAPAVTSDELAKLTKAERRVADLVAEGMSNQAIADQLFVSRHTVESHVKHIFTKLGLSSRVTLATLVLRESRGG